MSAKFEALGNTIDFTAGANHSSGDVVVSGYMIGVVQGDVLSGAIGQLMELRGRGKEDRRGGGEDLWVLGTHVMDLIRTFGGQPGWCYASVQQDG